MSEDTQMRNEFERAAYGQVKALESERDRWKAERFHADDLATAWKQKASKLAEALGKISKDQEFAIVRKVWYVEEAKRALAEFEKGK